MAWSKDLLGTLRSSTHWAPLGLAAVFGAAFFVIAVQGPGDSSAKDLTFFTTFEGLEPPPDSVVLAAASTPVVVQAASETSGDQSEVVRIPGDPAEYELLNAWRRDDGLIEITTQRTEGSEVATTIRLVRCAPLELGLIAESGASERNDSPAMERVVLGSAAAWMAAQACGAMK